MSISLWILIRPETSGVVLSAGDQSWPEEMEEGGGKEGRGETGGERKEEGQEIRQRRKRGWEGRGRKKRRGEERLNDNYMYTYTVMLPLVCLENLTNIGVAYNSCNQCQFL